MNTLELDKTNRLKNSSPRESTRKEKKHAPSHTQEFHKNIKLESHKIGTKDLMPTGAEPVRAASVAVSSYQL